MDIKYAIENSTLGIFCFKRMWRKRNPQNATYAVSCFPMDRVHVGEGTYGPLNIVSYRHGDCKLTIGKYCSLAKNTTILLGGEHPYDKLLSYPIEKYIFNEAPKTFSKGDIWIDDDVWIGYGVIILSGVHIGRGAVIAAGAVVYEDVPPYAVYGAGRVIKYRFSEEIRNRLMKIDFSKIDGEFIKKNRSSFEQKITDIHQLDIFME